MLEAESPGATLPTHAGRGSDSFEPAAKSSTAAHRLTPSEPSGCEPGARRVAFMMSHSAPGGILELWENLADGLAERGHDARVVALYPVQPVLNASGPPARVVHVSDVRPASVRGLLGLLLRLLAFFRSEPPDVVFTAMPAANVLVPLAARLARAQTQVVITHHTPVTTYNRLLAALDRWTGCLSNVRAVVVVSNAVGSTLDRHPAAYRAKRTTIYNALPPRIEVQIARLRAARSARGAGVARLLVATGRLAAQKNYPVLLRAAARLPDLRIEILGAGPDEAALRDLAGRLDLAGRVTFAGPVGREEALRRLACADAFVQPSLFEGHSLGLIEAASLHLPLIVSDVPVQVEGVTATDGRRCGTVVDPHDDVALAQAIGRVLDDPDYRQSAVADAAHLASARGYEAMISAYDALLSRP